MEAHIHCTTFQCCYIDSTASQHLFAALQAVTWDFSALKPKLAAWPKVTTAPYICPPASCLSPAVFFFWELWVWAHISVEAGRQGAGPMVVEGHKGAVNDSTG